MQIEVGHTSSFLKDGGEGMVEKGSRDVAVESERGGLRW